MGLLLMVLGLNVLTVIVLAISGSDKNIESRTEREIKIIKKHNRL